MNIRMIGMIICLIFSFNVYSKDQGGGKHLVLNLLGTGIMYEDMVPDLDGDGFDDPAICFDVDLVDMKNRHLVGTATDCLSSITFTGSGLELIGTSIFNFPQGTLITRGNTTVQPVLQPTVTPGGQPVTHITGAADTGNSIISGTGKYAGSTGTVRLSGMVDLSSFAGEAGDPISFDCIFIIDID